MENNYTSSYKDLTKEQISLLPSENDICAFEKNGWYSSPIILSDELIEKGVKGANEFYEGKRDHILRNQEGIANEKYSSESVLMNNEFVTLQKNEIRDIGFYPVISAIASKLSRVKEMRLFADSLICKKPENQNKKGIVGWHTDKAYWPTCSSNKLITVWIPFQDCTIDMGPVTYIDGSHKWKEDELKSFYSFNGQELSGLEDFLKETKKDFKKSKMTLKKGQVSFHHCHTIHCSFPNTSNRDRLALAIHLQDGENKYQKAFKDNGEPIVIGYDKLCDKDKDGNPDYRDPYYFPLLWRE